jgi:hypothetical protein
MSLVAHSARVSALCATGAFALAGCGSSTAVGPTRTVTVTLDEYRVLPTALTATPGQITVVVRNAGKRTHNLVISTKDGSIASTKPLWPGQTQNLTVALPAGSYVLTSTVLDDDSVGDFATLKVS